MTPKFYISIYRDDSYAAAKREMRHRAGWWFSDALLPPGHTLTRDIKCLDDGLLGWLSAIIYFGFIYIPLSFQLLFYFPRKQVAFRFYFRPEDEPPKTRSRAFTPSLPSYQWNARFIIPAVERWWRNAAITMPDRGASIFISHLRCLYISAGPVLTEWDDMLLASYYISAVSMYLITDYFPFKL